MSRRLFFSAFLCLTLTGCVTTQFYSKSNPEYKDFKYQRLLIKFADLQPAYSQYGEQAAQQAITEVYGKTIDCYLFSNEFYTGLRPRKEMAADVRAFEQDKKIDALLICITLR